MMMNLLCDADVIKYLDLKLSARYPGLNRKVIVSVKSLYLY